MFKIIFWNCTILNLFSQPMRLKVSWKVQRLPKKSDLDVRNSWQPPYKVHTSQNDTLSLMFRVNRGAQLHWTQTHVLSMTLSDVYQLANRLFYLVE